MASVGYIIWKRPVWGNGKMCVLSTSGFWVSRIQEIEWKAFLKKTSFLDV